MDATTPINTERCFRVINGGQNTSQMQGRGDSRGPEFQFSPCGTITEVDTHSLQTPLRLANFLEFVRARNSYLVVK